MARLRSGKTHRALGEKISFFIIWAIIIVTIIGLIWSQSNYLSVSELKYKNMNIPKSLNGYRIVNISNIDNTPLTLVSKVNKIKPDVVVLSGGYCDINGNYENSYNAVQEIASEYPTYYVYSDYDMEFGTDILNGTGAVNITDACAEVKNTKEYEDYMVAAYGDKFFNKVSNGQDRYKEFGEYSKVKLDETKDASIALFGVSEMTGADVEFNETDAYKVVNDKLNSTVADIKICVVPNTDFISYITECSVNAVLTGGTHGVKDNNDLEKGSYTVNGKKVYVSGGVGSLDTTRFFNFPEFEVITISDGTVLRPNPLENVLNTLSHDDPILDSDAGFKAWERSLNKSDDEEEDNT